MPASRTTLETLPANPNRIEPATTRPKPERLGAPARAGWPWAPGAGRTVSGVEVAMPSDETLPAGVQAVRGVVCCTAHALPSGSVK